MCVCVFYSPKCWGFISQNMHFENLTVVAQSLYKPACDWQVDSWANRSFGWRKWPQFDSTLITCWGPKICSLSTTLRLLVRRISPMQGANFPKGIDEVISEAAAPVSLQQTCVSALPFWSRIQVDWTVKIWRTPVSESGGSGLDTLSRGTGGMLQTWADRQMDRKPPLTLPISIGAVVDLHVTGVCNTWRPSVSPSRALSSAFVTLLVLLCSDWSHLGPRVSCELSLLIKLRQDTSPESWTDTQSPHIGIFGSVPSFCLAPLAAFFFTSDCISFNLLPHFVMCWMSECSQLDFTSLVRRLLKIKLHVFFLIPFFNSSDCQWNPSSILQHSRLFLRLEVWHKTQLHIITTCPQCLVLQSSSYLCRIYQKGGYIACSKHAAGHCTRG